MRAVQLRGDIERQPQPRPRAFHRLALRHRMQEITTETDKGAHLAAHNAFAAFDRGLAFPARRLESIQGLQHIQRRQFRFLGNADGTLALHIGMPANRQHARAGLADIATQQQQIDQHLNAFDAMLVLRHAHAVVDHRRIGPMNRRAPPLRIPARVGRTRFRVRPRDPAAPQSANCSKPCVCSLDERRIEHPRLAMGVGRIVRRDRRPCKFHHRRRIAAHFHLEILARNAGSDRPASRPGSAD